MPIKPENRALYPANWPEIVERIRQRSGNRCENCGVPNGVTGYRDEDGNFHRSWSNTELIGHKLIKIVLTVAHVDDPDPANCADENLAHWCQRCHNTHDAPMRAVHARETRRSRKAIGDLFQESTQ